MPDVVHTSPVLLKGCSEPLIRDTSELGDQGYAGIERVSEKARCRKLVSSLSQVKEASGGF
jgi:hypothetical protein